MARGEVVHLINVCVMTEVEGIEYYVTRTYSGAGTSATGNRKERRISTDKSDSDPTWDDILVSSLAPFVGENVVPSSLPCKDDNVVSRPVLCVGDNIDNIEIVPFPSADDGNIP